MAGMQQPVALITGAGRGIGRATAQELSQRGYRLALVSRTIEQLQETADLCKDAIAIAGNVASPESVKQIVDAAMKQLGRIDAFVHCAGLAPMLTIDELSLEQWHATIDTNLSAIFYFCKLLWPQWRAQHAGVVVNVSSYSARDPFPGFSAYGAAKAGVNLLGLSLAKEGEPLGIRVHTVAPAATETSMLRGILSPEQYPRENTLDPVDVARVIVQCVCGDLRHTSGEVIYVHKKF